MPPQRGGRPPAAGGAGKGRSPGAARTQDAARARPSAAAPDPAAESRALAHACTELGLTIDELQQRRLLDYCALLRKWNGVYNLTAVRDPGAMLVQHLFDCLAIIPVLRSPQDHLADGAVVLDVGSGGGLPGVVLAICLPGIEVHCVDTVGKKAAFVTQVRAELGLANLSAHHARVEELRAPRDLPPATLIVSRAFSSLAQFVGLTAHLRAPQGVWAAMKGQWPADELAALPATVRPGPAYTLRVPQLDAQRHVLLIEAASPAA
ncbi:16S rRNA (guanine(527)-N(7))-methyltransferase RsmG [Quisquiliibacterium transsilvanicum]|uniref:Ribosomal RNA small subunit methyltransferase G n=1 Tax=Quisquiliibacterium transsilvanicum TaxID=1549638 RepID=A0A7W8HIF9_9BURK|nr:16S rRNA (guanine(527)-N(7))-methyltransferase RsmG [Quisquiliibacterium transsilvanicum]MBB5272649.1 16S rRNA (guanine527-N7)-methyltransferase [Quisquiliibacterium transsilvanicum]